MKSCVREGRYCLLLLQGTRVFTPQDVCRCASETRLLRCNIALFSGEREAAGERETASDMEESASDSESACMEESESELVKVVELW